MADWMARMADFGTGLCPARLRYVAPSNSCHSCRQSMLPEADDAGVVAVAMDAPSESILSFPIHGSRGGQSEQEPNWEGDAPHRGERDSDPRLHARVIAWQPGKFRDKEGMPRVVLHKVANARLIPARVRTPAFLSRNLP